MSYICMTLRYQGQLIIIIIIIHLKDWQNIAEHWVRLLSMTSHLFSGGFLVIQQWKRGKWIDSFRTARCFSPHVRSSVKISPAQLNHISNRNVNGPSGPGHLTNIIVFFCCKNRIYRFGFSFKKRMVRTSKRIIFVFLPCIYLPSQQDVHVVVVFAAVAVIQGQKWMCF